MNRAALKNVRVDAWWCWRSWRANGEQPNTIRLAKHCAKSSFAPRNKPRLKNMTHTCVVPS
jgi:hypothetical protein